MADAVVRSDIAVAMAGGTITGVAPLGELRARHPGAVEIDCAQRVLTPGLVDSHTHAIFGRARYEEQEYRAAGMDYMEIARRGGGIHSSVRDLRARDEAELEVLGERRLRLLASFGITTVEVKSGYGLSLDDEMKTLRVIRRLAERLPMRIIPTFLGAHEIPLDHRESAATRRAYIEIVINEMLPAVADGKLARFADVFCETGVYTGPETREILSAARAHGLGLKLHADELTSCGGAELAAEIGATSADHLAAVSVEGIRALAGSGTVATLLPGTMSFLGKMKQAPARALIDAGVPVAIATDFNPGTSPTPNLPLVMSFGLSQLRMSAHETFIAATVNGAAALGLADHAGQIAEGHSADLALWDVEDFREIPYWYGDRRCYATWARGKACHQRDLDLG
jgi:imidazolonepropionase